MRLLKVFALFPNPRDPIPALMIVLAVVPFEMVPPTVRPGVPTALSGVVTVTVRVVPAVVPRLTAPVPKFSCLPAAPM